MLYVLEIFHFHWECLWISSVLANLGIILLAIIESQLGFFFLNFKCIYAILLEVSECIII